MRLLHFVFFSLGLPLILQATVSDDGEILQKPEPILTNVTTCILLSQDSSSELTTIEVSAKNGKTLVLDGINLSEGFSVVDNDSSQDGLKAILETVIIKNFNIDYNLIESISNILMYYCKTLNDLIIDSCSLKLQSQLSDLSLKVKKLKIINSDLGKDFLINFETIDELSLHHSNLAIIDNPDTVYLNIKKLEVFNSDLSQNFLHFLNDHRKLEELIVKNCKLSFDSVQNVSFGIKRLEISYCSLSKCFNRFLYSFELLEEFIFDNCILPSPNFGRTFSTNIKKLELINCINTENMLNAILFNSKDVLEDLTIDHFYFTNQFVIHNNFKLKELHTVKITYCAFNEEILIKTLSLFPSSLQTLELSHLCINNSVDNHQLYGECLILDFVYLNVERFAHLISLAVKENDIIKFRFENFEELEEFECDKVFQSYDLLKDFYDKIKLIATYCLNSTTIKLDTSRDLSAWIEFTERYHFDLLNAFYISAEIVSTEPDNALREISESIKQITEKCIEFFELQKSVNDYSDVNKLRSKLFELSNEISKLQVLIPKECPKLFDKLEKLNNLKRIKTDEYDFGDSLNYFAERNIIVDSSRPIEILRNDLSHILKILSTFVNVCIPSVRFTDDDINTIQLGNVNNFGNLKDVTFYNVSYTYNIAFMNWVLKSFHGIRTITVEPSFYYVTAEHITESFNGIENYDEIENVHFTDLFNDTLVTCEFIIQILKRVPNLKYLSFTNLKEDISDVLFNRLQEEQLRFPNLKTFHIDDYNGSINFLIWFMQTFPIEEVSIDSELSYSLNGVLDNFLNTTLGKLLICRAPKDNYIILRKCFDGMLNLKELHFEYNFDLITLFENNSTIEKVIFENTWFSSEYSQVSFPILETFKSLRSIYVEFSEHSHSYVIATFKKHFEGRNVKLIFYSEEGYFQ